MTARPVPAALQGAPAEIAGLMSPQVWDRAALTFAFPDDAAVYGEAYSAAREPERDFAALSPAAADVVRAAFRAWEAVSGLVLTEVGPDEAADLRIAASTAPAVAWAYEPGPDARDGDVWLDLSAAALAGLSDPDAALVGTYAWHTVLHEIGHALALKHGHEGVVGNALALPTEWDGMAYTLMTYRSVVGQSRPGGYSNEAAGYAQTPMLLDIAAMQALYGPNYGHRAGNTVYALSPETGALIVDGAAEAAPADNRVFRALWDGGGVDTLDLSAYATDLRVDLRPGGVVDLDADGTAQRALLAPGARAPGHLWLARLHQGDPHALIENARSGSGDDALIGNAADNRLEGGAGADTLAGGDGADVFAGTLADLDGDRITDFGADDRLEAGGLAGPLAGGLAALEGGAAALRLDSDAGAALLRLDFAAGAPLALALAQTGGAATLAAAPTGSVALGDGGVRFAVGAGGAAGRILGGGAGADVIRAGDGGATLIGGGGSNLLVGGVGDDMLAAGSGGDILTGGGGADVFRIAAPRDATPTIHILTDFDPADDRLALAGPLAEIATIRALPGALAVVAGATAAVLRGLDPGDADALRAALTLSTEADALALLAVAPPLLGGGDALIVGGAAPVRLRAGDGGALLAGGAGGDALTGGAGDDTLAGGGGGDALEGGAGSNLLIGGAGADVFRFVAPDPAAPATTRRDVIADFAPGEDALAFEGAWDAAPVAAETADGLSLALAPGWSLLVAGLDAAAARMGALGQPPWTLAWEEAG